MCRSESLFQLFQLSQTKIAVEIVLISLLYYSNKHVKGCVSRWPKFLPECCPVPALLPSEEGLVVHVGGSVVGHGGV